MLPGQTGSGVTRAELLHGARNLGNLRKLLGFLNTFQQGSIPDAIWETVGENLAALRAAGLTIPFAEAPDGTLLSAACSFGV